MKKPQLYIVANSVGGTRKSTALAYLTLALKARGEEPLLVALDTNNMLQSLLPKDADYIKWDINNAKQSQQNLETIVAKAHDTEQPIVIDMAASGGASLGVHTLLDTGIFKACSLTAVVPVMPDTRSASGACDALQLLEPDRWLLVQFDTKHNEDAYNRLPKFKKLLKKQPAGIIKPEELTGEMVATLQSNEIALSEMEDAILKDPMGTLGLRVFSKFWNGLLPQFKKSIESVAPNTNYAPTTTPVTSDRKHINLFIGITSLGLAGLLLLKLKNRYINEFNQNQ